MARLKKIKFLFSENIVFNRKGGIETHLSLS